MFFKAREPSQEQIQMLMQLYAQGQLDDLIDEALRLARKFPKAAQVHNILSVAYNAAGEYHDAVTSAEQASRLQPDYPKAFLNLGNAQANLGEQDEAVESYSQAVRIAPDFAEGHNNLGCALIELGRIDEGIASLKTAIELNPDYAKAYNNLGGALLDIGCKQDAIASFRRAIELNPNYAEACRQLSNLITFNPDEPLYKQMRGLLDSEEQTDTQRMHLLFGLAKAEDDLGDLDQYFAYLQKGSRLHKQLSGYGIEEDRELFKSIKASFATPVPQLSIPAVDTEFNPVFVVGMPRSGTTLVEQILSCHSRVYGAGEVPTLERGLEKIGWYASAITPAQLNELRVHYMSWLKSLKVSESHVTDKTTINFRWIGFILCAMPEARIIHIKRDARATCWSIFRHFFDGNGHGYAYNLNDLSEYYKLYVDLMAFWEEVFPGRIHHINYEALTEDQEAQTRKLIGYCELEWEDRCLDFHLSKRSVSTASHLQVRKKMYQGSSDVWRRYEAHLQPMIRQLEGL